MLLTPACEALPELLYFGGDETFASKSMKTIQGYHLIKPEDLLAALQPDADPERGLSGAHREVRAARSTVT